MSGTAQEEYRVFTDGEGREIRAKIVRIDIRSRKITLERENQRKATVPLNIFSEPDQVYIREWLKAQDFMSQAKLKVELNRRKQPVEENRSETKRPKPPIYYEINLENRSDTDLTGLTVEYCIYAVTDLAQGDDELKLITGSEEDLQLKPGARKNITSDQVKLYRRYEEQTEVSYDQYGGRSMSTSYNKISEDDLEGVWVKLTYTTPSGKRFVRNICDPKRLQDKFTWRQNH